MSMMPLLRGQPPRWLWSRLAVNHCGYTAEC